MKGKILYLFSAAAVLAPWLFLLEWIPIPYHRISTAAEVIAEAVMFLALLAAVILLRKELRQTGSSRTDRIAGRILFVLASVTLVLVGLVLALVAVSFTL